MGLFLTQLCSMRRIGASPPRSSDTDDATEAGNGVGAAQLIILSFASTRIRLPRKIR